MLLSTPALFWMCKKDLKRDNPYDTHNNSGKSLPKSSLTLVGCTVENYPTNDGKIRTFESAHIKFTFKNSGPLTAIDIHGSINVLIPNMGNHSYPIYSTNLAANDTTSVWLDIPPCFINSFPPDSILNFIVKVSKQGNGSVPSSADTLVQTVPIKIYSPLNPFTGTFSINNGANGGAIAGESTLIFLSLKNQISINKTKVYITNIDYNHNDFVSVTYTSGSLVNIPSGKTVSTGDKINFKTISTIKTPIIEIFVATVKSNDDCQTWKVNFPVTIN